MQPSSNFTGKPSQFWALVRSASEHLKYSDRGATGKMRTFKQEQIEKFAKSINADGAQVSDVTDYMNYRATQLETQVKSQLMNRQQAKTEFDRLKRLHNPKCNLPMNKQKKEKRHEAYFTCIINILTEAELKGRKFADNPKKLIRVRDNAGRLVATMSRQLDGAYPTLDTPRVIWEVKEYYGTTTFGSRVADGVYETLLDGYEINAAAEEADRRINHYLLVDDYFTWWEKGRPYLCRLVDAMHMGLVDEVIFGREVLTRWPQIVQTWP